MSLITLLHGDCRERLRELEDNSIDSIVTDPPYELGFMGKRWDATGIAYDVALWRECLRVLKPSGHLLSFGGSRTFHRMAVAIEEAGFELKTIVLWVQGQGFPKSANVSKMLGKKAGVGSEVAEVNETFSEVARQWNGWGSSLKPAHEPIVWATKPSEGHSVPYVAKDPKRLFYCAKANAADRDEGLEGMNIRKKNTHPTVKPTELMKYLCSLVTLEGGVVLDPFMGSGSTGRGSVLGDFDFIGIEKEQEYLEIARARISAAQRDVRSRSVHLEQLSLF